MKECTKTIFFCFVIFVKSIYYIGCSIWIAFGRIERINENCKRLVRDKNRNIILFEWNLIKIVMLDAMQLIKWSSGWTKNEKIGRNSMWLPSRSHCEWHVHSHSVRLCATESHSVWKFHNWFFIWCNIFFSLVRFRCYSKHTHTNTISVTYNNEPQTLDVTSMQVNSFMRKMLFSRWTVQMFTYGRRVQPNVRNSVNSLQLAK